MYCRDELADSIIFFISICASSPSFVTKAANARQLIVSISQDFLIWPIVPEEPWLNVLFCDDILSKYLCRSKSAKSAAKPRPMRSCLRISVNISKSDEADSFVALMSVKMDLTNSWQWKKTTFWVELTSSPRNSVDKDDQGSWRGSTFFSLFSAVARAKILTETFFPLVYEIFYWAFCRQFTL